MTEHHCTTELRALTEESRAIWNAKAAFWDERMGEGNVFQRLLVGPATERLLELREGELVLDAACGNGVMSRRLASLGARVVGCDFSEVFIERARARTPAELADRISYQVVDATNEEELLALGTDRFDAIVCNQAFMDMATIDPLLRAARHLLTSNGRFVFVNGHPSFNTSAMSMVAEQEERDGSVNFRYGVTVWGYVTPWTRKAVGMPNEPEPHYYFHRSLSAILASCFGAGFVLDGLEEPAFLEPYHSGFTLNWGQMTEIPPLIAGRLRPAGTVHE
jgi:2-polyprenyl-3-methyl-5-hydroxy-6-metoxy-1,4-benzoquinol methylase